MVPHWGRRKALEGDRDCDGLVALGVDERMRRGDWLSDGMNTTKWSTGSLDALDAVCNQGRNSMALLIEKGI